MANDNDDSGVSPPSPAPDDSATQTGNTGSVQASTSSNQVLATSPTARPAASDGSSTLRDPCFVTTADMSAAPALTHTDRARQFSSFACI